MRWLLCNLPSISLRLAAAAPANNNDNRGADGGSADDGGARFPCLHCGLTLLLPNERCPRCHRVGRRIAQIVNERMIIRDRTVRVLSSIEKNYWYLIGSLAVTVCIPILFLEINLDPVRSTVFSVIAGLVSLILGFYGIVSVRRIFTEI